MQMSSRQPCLFTKPKKSRPLWGAILNLEELKLIYFQILKMNLYFAKKKRKKTWRVKGKIETSRSFQIGRASVGQLSLVPIWLRPVPSRTNCPWVSEDGEKTTQRTVESQHIFTQKWFCLDSNMLRRQGPNVT